MNKHISKDIKEKYPKAYKKTLDDLWLDDIDSFGRHNIKNICFCGLVNFFDSVGVEIFIYPYGSGNYVYVINSNNRNSRINSAHNMEYFKTRHEAQEASILKAFSILEERLNNE